MNKIIVIIYCMLSSLMLVSCYESLGEQTIIGTFDSIKFPYVLPKYNWGGVEVGWAPAIKVEDGREYIISNQMFVNAGGEFGSYSGDTNAISLEIYVNHYLEPDVKFWQHTIYEGDTIMATGELLKRYYSTDRNTRDGVIKKGEYYFIDGNIGGIKIVNRGKPYQEWIGEIVEKIRL